MMTCRRCRQTVLQHAQRTHRCPTFNGRHADVSAYPPARYPTFDPAPEPSYSWSSSSDSSSADSYSGGGGTFGGGGASGDF